MSKKKLIALALVVIMIATVSFSTLAWFTDKDEVTNQFMVAGSEDKNPDDIFSVDVWENTPAEDGDQDGHKYENILPGDKLQKEVKVQNTGAYDQYIRVTVEITDAKVWMEVLGEDFNDDTLIACFDGYVDANWRREHSEVDAEADVIRITMYYNGGRENPGVVAPGDEIDVFSAVNIPTSLTQEQAAEFGEYGFNIKVTAEAVQTKNVGVDSTNTICDAYEAFCGVGLA